MNAPQVAQGTQPPLFSESTNPSPLLRAPPLSFTMFPTFETPAVTRDIGQPPDVDEKPIYVDEKPLSTVSDQTPLGGDPYSVPAEVITVNPSDFFGTPSAPQGGAAPASLSKRRKASLNAKIPTAKRTRRAPQLGTPENTGPQTDAGMDAARGFENLNLAPEVQQAMRDLIVRIRAAPFARDNEQEPNIGTHEAVELMAVAPPELWHGFGTKAKSIYSLFVRVDGKECKCLWCGDVQQGKLQRAVGHVRAKHMGHEPYLCGEVHVEKQDGDANVENRVW